MMYLTTDGIQSQWEEPVRKEKEDACKESLVGGRPWDATEEDVLLANETFAPLGADERGVSCALGVRPPPSKTRRCL